ncbi:MAG: Na+/H+ antiporter subunit E [Anaerolineales bacterium]|nr:Na+/H+ antiporter subunit E [Anaerolineales bacterium]
MTLLLLNVLLALAWAALTGSFKPVDLIFGFVLGYLVLWLVLHKNRPRYFRALPLAISLLFYFLTDVLRANLRIAATVLSPRMKLRPAVVAVPLILKSEAATILLANMITLTPGTLSLDVSTDHQILFVHTVWLDDVEAFRRQVVDGYERRLKELFEP